MPNFIHTCSTSPEVLLVGLRYDARLYDGSAQGFPSTTIRDVSYCDSGWSVFDLDSLSSDSPPADMLADLSLSEIESLMSGVLIMFTVAFVFKFIRRQFSKSDT
jgi:hypothetical protein